VFSFIAAEKANYPVALMCRVLSLNRTSFLLPLQPIVSGRYYHRFQRRDGQWRLVERRVRSDLVGDVSRDLRRPAADP
jgi:hypothetical protein